MWFRMRKGGAALLAGALALAGCGDAGPAAPAARRPLYFDVKGLLAKQVKLLEQRHAAVTKQVSLRGNATETVRVPTVKWADELQIFFQADINKAALRGAYTVDSAALPGGLVRRTYTRLPGQPNAPVSLLTVTQQGGVPQEIAATIVQNNPLFSAQKQLRVRLRNGLLYSYEVMGTQKLIIFDTLRYTAAGQVN
jgi:3',5'-cyclic AMP phosphodiesterase CpdA